VLQGEKKYFLQSDVPNVYVPRNKLLSVERVYRKVAKNPVVSEYLPDYDAEIEKRMDRDFLFSIINKLDVDFFTRALDELDLRGVAKQ
jgi:hypothetical protein